MHLITKINFIRKQKLNHRLVFIGLTGIGSKWDAILWSMFCLLFMLRFYDIYLKNKRSLIYFFWNRTENVELRKGNCGWLLRMRTDRWRMEEIKMADQLKMARGRKKMTSMILFRHSGLAMSLAKTSTKCAEKRSILSNKPTKGNGVPLCINTLN